MKSKRMLGSHVSISGGLLGAAQEAASYGANTFMLYTGAPQNTIRKKAEQLKIPEGIEFMEQNGISDIVVHAPYIVNMASYKKNIYELAKSFMKTEIETTKKLGSKYIVVHPGSYTDKDMEYGIKQISNALNEIIEDTDAPDAPFICLETMAGKGSEIGGTFEQLAQIIEMVNNKDRIGVCLDTCHIHDSGYDIQNSLDDVLSQFDNVLGIDRIMAVHLNGSLNEKGAHKDRHANLGAENDNPRGTDKIGFNAIRNVFLHKLLTDKIFILETPWLDNKTNLYKEEIAALREEEYNERD